MTNLGALPTNKQSVIFISDSTPVTNLTHLRETVTKHKGNLITGLCEVALVGHN